MSTFKGLSPLRTLALAAVTFFAVFMFVRTADAAWPRLLMVHGVALDKPIVIDDWDGIRDIFDGRVVNNEDLEGRHQFDLTLFWGEEWNRYVEEGRSLDTLRPEDAITDVIVPMTGRFYPACGESAAAIAVDTFDFASDSFDRREIVRVWDASAAGLEVLGRFGVDLKCNRE